MTTNPAAGWYADPNDSSGLRYWDGTTWTEHTHRADAAPAAAAAPSYDAGAVPSYDSSAAAVPPYDAGAGAVSPAGYAAPGQVEAAPAQAYGSYTQASGIIGESPKKGLGRGAITAIVAGGIAVLAAIIIVIVLVINATSTEEPVADGDPVIPSGWETTDSPSGSISYAHPADLSDGNEFVDLEMLEDELASSLATDLPGASAEVSGMWVDVSTTTTGGSSIILMTMENGVNANLLGVELNAFAESSSAGATDVQIGKSVKLNTAVGYNAASLDYSSSNLGTTMYATVAAATSGDTAVFVFNTSPVDAATAAALNKQVVDSLVINDTP